MITASFFSYKGGSGRTSLLFNVIPYLAEKLHASPEHPIVICDCDTESAGLTFLLDQYKANPTISLQRICNDGIPGEDLEVDSIREHPFFKALPQVADKFGIKIDGYDGSILFLPADKGSERLNNVNMNPLDNLKKLCLDNGVSALIFDTPAGDQKAAKWSVETSKIIVAVMRITRQFRIGTRRYFQEHLDEWENKHVILVPNAVPDGKIKIRGEEVNLDELKQNEIIDVFEEVFSGSSNYLDLGMLENDKFGVNEVARFKYIESVLYSEDSNNLSDDEKKAVEQYENLAELIGK